MMEFPQVLTNDQGVSGGRKKSRNRVITSCSECNRRKQKCNRQWPCNHCLSRRAVQLCHYNVTRPKSKLDYAANTGQSEMGHGICSSLQAAARTHGTSGSAAPLEEGNGEETMLEEIGGPEGASSSVLGTIFYPDMPSKEAFVSTESSPRSRNAVLNIFPPRNVVDFLVQHFLAEINWLYEEIYPQIFLEKYNNWWYLPSYESDDDIQFGVLILRLCVNSLQFLPHPNYPTHGLINEPLEDTEARCDAAAVKLDSYQPRKPSLLRIQQLLIYIPTLTNSGEAQESSDALHEAVKEAQSINLFLEEKWGELTELDKEERRKTFWNLYVWDRWHSTFLGRWPLIPDLYFTVQLPSERPYSTDLNSLGAPTMFTDVLLNIKICQFMHLSFSAPAKKAERLDPIVVASHFKTFQEEFIDKLPPVFQLHDPDTSWDERILCLRRKREWVHIGTWGVIESMHKGFVGAASKQRHNRTVKAEMAELVCQHRTTLLNACINIIASLRRLHLLIGGGSHRYFFLSVCCIEASAVLGMCLLSESPAAEYFGRELLERSYNAFADGLELLGILSQRSPLAQKGIGAMRKLNTRVLEVAKKELREHNRSSPNAAQAPKNLPAVVGEPEENHGAQGGFTHVVDGRSSQDAAIFKEWEAFSASSDFSWFFEDNMFMNPEGFGMDFRSSF